jgi:hypothetical protein
MRFDDVAEVPGGLRRHQPQADGRGRGYLDGVWFARSRTRKCFRLSTPACSSS